MVYRGDKSKLGSMVFVVINREAIDVLKNRETNAVTKTDENKKSLTCDEVKDDEVTTCDEVETNNLKKSIDDTIIHENEEKYTSNLEKDLEKNVNDDIEDIEAKNKRLMEEEKVFVPSFRGWN